MFVPYPRREWMQTRPRLWLSFCLQFSCHNAAAKTFGDISRSPLCTPVLSPTEECFIIKLSLLPVRASCFSVSFSPLLILTGSLSDNSGFLLPGRASCFHCMKFSQELVLLLLPTGLLLLYRGGMIHGSGKHYPFHRAKHRERLYTVCACVDVSMEQSFDYLLAWTRGTRTELWESCTGDFKHCLSTVCWRPSVSSCPAACFFSVLHFCWSVLVQTHWSQPTPLPLDSCWSLLRK